jgi:hypothetical protein
MSFADSVNYFAGSVVNQSSTLDGQEASLAIDGNLLTCMSTMAELKPWWQIDLGNHFHLLGVVIYTNSDPACEEDWSCCKLSALFTFYNVLSIKQQRAYRLAMHM